jgi:hypothetical protein
VTTKLTNKSSRELTTKGSLSAILVGAIAIVAVLMRLGVAQENGSKTEDIRAQNLHGRLLSKEEQRNVNNGIDNNVRFTPIHVEEGINITLIAPSEWSDVAEDVSAEIKATHRQLIALFGSIPAFRSSVRLLNESQFYDLTGAPAWTNAMFFRGEIIIPLTYGEPIDLENLQRSVKHEYSHAVFSSLSGGAIPGWLDEGLAQWLEGDENPALRRTLKSFLRNSDPVPMRLLQGGFTKLPHRMVPAAYAQSLLAVQALLKAYGVESIGMYLALLKRKVSTGAAFKAAFRISEDEFELRLSDALKVWAGRRESYQSRLAMRGDSPRGNSIKNTKVAKNRDTQLMSPVLR